MPHNIEGIRILSSTDLHIPTKEWERLRDEVRNSYRHFPESSFLCHSWRRYCTKERNGNLYFTNLWWSGESSGWAWNRYGRDTLSALRGSADLVVVWAGAALSPYKLRDGVLTQANLVLT